MPTRRFVFNTPVSLHHSCYKRRDGKRFSKLERVKAALETPRGASEDLINLPIIAAFLVAGVASVALESDFLIFKV
jgi:hypothetical protein